tara:strand:- start:207 stop:1193 length:987 start_codon:yes stop_codon:yes gene_type:complete
MYINTKVLVTGADGFIGSHLVEALIQSGASVKALSLYNSFNHWGWLEDISCLDEVDVVTGDIRDPFFCQNITKDVDLIFHLAALIAIPYSYQAPQSYVETNILGTLNLCEAAKKNQSRLIQTSTSEVYGTAQYVPIDEKHPLQPQSPYSASKIGADAMAMSYFNAFDLPVTIARPFNTYGPRQSARAVIPTIITQIASNQPSVQLGDTSPTRDLNFVEDTCFGLMSLASCPDAIGQTVNIGSNDEISILDLFKTIKTIMGSSIELCTDNQRVRPQKSEVFRLKCNNEKLKQLTGYEPRHTLASGLEKTCEWFSNPDNLLKYKASIYNV